MSNPTPTEDPHQELWGDAVRRLGYAVRRFVSDRILEENPNLEELGSSDVNCFAINWIRNGTLIVDDGPPRWTDRD